MADVLSETPVLDERPRNEVDIQLQNGGTRRLYVDNRAISRPSNAMKVIEDAVANYISKHDDAIGAVIFRVNEKGDRAAQKSI